MDLRPLLRPRHLLLTLLVGLLAGGTIAAAGAAPDPDVPSGLGAPMAFPPRAVGDRGVYEVWGSAVAANSDPDTWGEPDRTIAFEWLPDERHLDGNGQLVWANVLRIRESAMAGSTPVEREDLLWLRAGTDEAFATVFEEATAIDQDDLPVGAGPSSNTGRSVLFREDDLWGFDPCLVLPTQGTTLRLTSAPLEGFTSCRWINAGFGDEAAKVRVQAVGGEPGHRELLLHGTVPNLLQTDVVGRMWLREGLAYPIRLEEAAGIGNDGVVLLRSFSPGTLPLRMSQDLAPGPVPDLAFAPRHAWGPDEAGVEHAFPLSAALAAARQHDGEVRDLFAAAPDAYVAYAQYATFDLPDRLEQRWTVMITDGATVLGREIHQRTPTSPATAPRDPDALLQGQVLPAPYLNITPTEWRPYDAGEGPLPPAEAPAQMATVASMLAQWQAYAADMGRIDVAANEWGFDLRRDVDGPGGVAGVSVWAGHISYRDAPLVPGPAGMLSEGTTTWMSSHVMWRDDVAGATYFSEGNSTAQGFEAEVPAAAQEAVPGPAPAQDQFANEVSASDVRFEWTPRERAAIGLGALFAGLLWWLSPLAKGGLSGLFSRIRDDDLLDNPTRRLARDLVEANPGMHHQDLVRRLGKGKGGAEHHLRKLVDGGVLLRRAAHGYTCYFLPAQASRAAVAAAPLLKSPVAQRIVDIKRAEPMVTNAELARRLDVRPATIHYHLTRLRQAGLVVDLASGEDTAQPA